MRQGRGRKGTSARTMLGCALALLLMGGCGAKPADSSGQTAVSAGEETAAEEQAPAEEVQPAKKETDPLMSACEAETREYLENLDQHHAERRAPFEDMGWQTFEGTVVIMGGEDVCALSGVPINANGESVAQRWRDAQYAFLKFDQPTEVRDILIADDHITGVYDYVCIGRNDFGSSSVDQWREYEGKRICVTSSLVGMSSGVDLLAWPSLDSAMLLYRLRTSTVEQMLDHDFNTKYFYVDVPDSWADESWQVEKVDEFTYTFSQTADGQGSATITGGNGLQEGFEILGTVDSDGGLLLKQEGDGFFGEGKAQVSVRSYL